MGEFKSGKWIIILFIYFAVFYLITSSIILATIETTGKNPQIGFTGETDFQNILDPFETGGLCTGRPSVLACSNIDNNDSCEFLRGCNWIASTNISGKCLGAVGDPETGFALSICLPKLNYTYCTLAGCSWTTYTADGEETNRYGSSSTHDISTFQKTVSVMMGFGVDIDEPTQFSWAFQLFFFWIPFMMLTWSIYMALPFAH